MRPQYVSRTACPREHLAIHQEGLGVGLLEVGDAQDHGLYLGLDVVRLVDHVLDAGPGPLLGLHELHVDQVALMLAGGHLETNANGAGGLVSASSR